MRLWDRAFEYRYGTGTQAAYSDGFSAKMLIKAKKNCAAFYNVFRKADIISLPIRFDLIPGVWPGALRPVGCILTLLSKRSITYACKWPRGLDRNGISKYNNSCYNIAR